jgi:hypothetical protein
VPPRAAQERAPDQTRSGIHSLRPHRKAHHCTAEGRRAVTPKTWSCTQGALTCDDSLRAGLAAAAGLADVRVTPPPAHGVIVSLGAGVNQRC